MRERLSFGAVLLTALVGCSGIHERTVLERASGGGTGGSSGIGSAGEGGASVVAGSGGNNTAAAPTVGGKSSAGAPTMAEACGSELTTIPLHALSSWEYSRSVMAITGTAVDASKLPHDVTPDAPFVEMMDLGPAAVAALLAEAERQGEEARHHPLLPCPIDKPVDGACAAAFVDQLVGVAFRRPLSPPERARYVDLFKAATGTGDFAAGVQVVVEAALLSPLFLFKSYLSDNPDNTGAQRALSPTELAARLALVLTGAPPDAELSAAAEKSDLAPGGGLERQVDRLLALPTASDTVVRFFSTWLGLRELDALASPELSPELLASLRGETEHMVEGVFNATGSFSDLLTSNKTIVDGTLANHYGVEPPSDEQGLVGVTLDGGNRSGLLTQGSTLVHFPNPSRRGRFIRERLFCQPVPEPPPGVDRTVTIEPQQTRRQAWQAHQSDPACAACHGLIDPIGYGLENFDAQGLYRTQDNGQAIDASGELLEPADGIQAGPFSGPTELAERLVMSSAVSECVSRAWLSYALQRELFPSDDCTVQLVLGKVFTPRTPRIKDLMRATLLSHAFRTRDSLKPMPGPSPQIGSGPFQPALARQKALLDLVIAEAKWLQPQVGSSGPPLIESFITSVRQVQQQLGTQGTPGPQP